MSKKRDLFIRHGKGPVITADMLPYSPASVCNPGAINFEGEVLLLLRVINRKNHSYLVTARSKNGKTNWKFGKPIRAEERFGESISGLEDPRIVWVKELSCFVIACVSFRKNFINNPHAISLLKTKDFVTFERISQPILPSNKNPCLFPERIKGRFALIHRPVIDGRAYIGVSFSPSPDLIYFGDHKPLFSPRPDSWDTYRVGIGTQPIKTKEGWLIIYHGSWGKANGLVYRVGLALLSLEDLKLTHRSDEWIFGPEKNYEGNIVFPCGAAVDNSTGKVMIYYGADDSSVGMAETKVEHLLEFVMSYPVE